MADIEETIRNALTTDRTIDITTVGRKSGQPRRTEIWFRNRGGRIFITGLPGTRSWLANMRASPEFTFHLKESVQADLQARARIVTDEDERRQVLRLLLDGQSSTDFEEWVARSPLVEVEFLQERLV